MAIRHALVHVFSGTGNTRRAADGIGAALERKGVSTRVVSIEDCKKVDSQFDDDIDTLHVFMFPVYATAVPAVMVRYMHAVKRKGESSAAAVLRRRDRRLAAVVATNGRVSTRIRDGYQGWALHQARLHLTRAGFDVALSETLDYPHNVTAFIPPGGSERNRRIVESAEEHLEEIADALAHRRRRHRRFWWVHAVWSYPLGLLFTAVGHRFIGRLFSADVTCSGCGRCARRCPARAIRMVGGRPEWSWRCEACLRCFNECPTRSIQVPTVRLGVVFALSIWNPVRGIVRDMFPGVWGWGAGVLVYAATVVVALLLLDVATRRVASRVPRLPTMLGLLTWGHTSLYGRYTAAPFRGNYGGDDAPNDPPNDDPPNDDASGNGTPTGSL